MYNKYVTIDSDIQSGTPVFTGTRVPIQNLFDYIEEGNAIGVFLDQFPSVSKNIAIAVLKQAHEALLHNALEPKPMHKPDFKSFLFNAPKVEEFTIERQRDHPKDLLL